MPCSKRSLCARDARPEDRAREALSIRGRGGRDDGRRRQRRTGPEKADIGVAMGLRGTQVAREAAPWSFRTMPSPPSSRHPRRPRHLRQYPPIPRLSALLQSQRNPGRRDGLPSGLPLPLFRCKSSSQPGDGRLPRLRARHRRGREGRAEERPPRNPREPLLGGKQWLFVAACGTLLAIATLGALMLGRYWLDLEGEALVTLSFLTLALGQLWQVFNMRDARAGLFFRNTVTRNRSVWMALALCTAILLVALYWPPLAETLQIPRRRAEMAGLRSSA